MTLPPKHPRRRMTHPTMPNLEPALIDHYDTVILDLDGVVYRGSQPVPGVPDGIADLRGRTQVGYVTNNAARTPEDVATHLDELGIVAETSDVITAAQAGAQLVAHRCGSGTRVLALGADGLWAALRDAGMVPVTGAHEGPAAVLQGLDPRLCWEQLAQAALAIRQGAVWVATNTDPTRPTDRGLELGNGAAVAALQAAVSAEPEIAGKPYPPLMAETLRRLHARDPVVVGDRLDTDIAGAAAVGADSVLVLTGSHGPADAFGAAGMHRPTHVRWSVADLVRSVADVDVDAYACDGTLRLSRPPGELDRAGLAAGTERAARLCWQQADTAQPLNYHDVAEELAAAIARLR